jgi:hypothetical protein
MASCVGEDLFGVNAEDVGAAQRHDRKRLVELPEIDVVNLYARGPARSVSVSRMAMPAAASGGPYLEAMTL